jgi:hypothetical protein
MGTCDDMLDDGGLGDANMMVSTNSAQRATLTFGMKFFTVLLRGVNPIISVKVENGDSGSQGITFEGLLGMNRLCSSEVNLMLDTDIT